MISSDKKTLSETNDKNWFKLFMVEFDSCDPNFVALLLDLSPKTFPFGWTLFRAFYVIEAPSYICNATFQAEEDKKRWRRRAKMIHRRYSTYNPNLYLKKSDQTKLNQAKMIHRRYSTFNPNQI